MATRKRASSVHGLVLLDKPADITSFTACRKVGKIFGTRRVGHGGTLDPSATGVLVVFVGEATKYASFALDSNKRYLTEARWGMTSDTLDADGEIVETANRESKIQALTEQRISSSIADKFTGDIEQVPPMYSALKVRGRPLYKYARNNEQIQRQPRSVHIESLTLQDYAQGSEYATFDVCCSKGTYIRSLIADIGTDLGVGALVNKLRRTETCGVTIDDCVSLEDLADSADLADLASTAVNRYLISCDRHMQHLPTITIAEHHVQDLQHGRVIPITSLDTDVVASDTAIVRIRSQESQIFAGLARLAKSSLAPYRMLSLDAYNDCIAFYCER